MSLPFFLFLHPLFSTPMSNRSITEIIKQWRTPFVTKKKRLTSQELKSIVKESPNSLKARLAVNPHANVLASPLRFCTFHNRFLPSKLMLRFGQAYHPSTGLIWAFPTLKKQGGKGVYVNLSKKVLELFGKGPHRSAFRGAATYRSDMTDHVRQLLFKETFDLFSERSLSAYTLLKSIAPSIWEESTQFSSPMGYQCILMFDTSDTTCELNHQIHHQSNIPCYHVHHFWTKEQIQHIQEQLKVSQPFALGVPKDLNTVNLSISLWRCRKFLDVNV